MFSKRTVTLNIETDAVRFLVADGMRVGDWGSVPLDPGLVRDGLIYEPTKVSSVIDALFREKKLPKNRVIASLPSLRSLTRIFNLPKVKPALLEEAIRNEAEREMPVPLEELYLCWQLINGKGEEQRFFVLGVPHDVLDAELKALGQAGIRPVAMDLKPLALARVVDREEALILDLEPESFGIILVASGVPVAMRTLVSRGEAITLEDRIGQLASELARTVEFYNNSHPEHSIGATTPAFLTGSLAVEEVQKGKKRARKTNEQTGASQLVKAAIDNPVETLSIPFSCPPDLPIGQYAVNIGLALRQAPSRRKTKGGVLGVKSLNVLPREYLPRPLPVRSIAYGLIAVLLIGMFFPIYQLKTASEAEGAGIQAELRSMGRQTQRDRLAITSITDMETKAKILKEARAFVLGTGNFSDNLKLVLGALPPGVRLTSISETKAHIGLTGEADGRSEVIRYVANLEGTGTFSKVYLASLSGGVGDTSSTLVTFDIQAELAP